jgi:phosphoribosylanthranilate isomerase
VSKGIQHSTLYGPGPYDRRDMPRTRIAVCGIMNEEQAFAAADAGADALGFVFTRSDPRRIDPEEAYAIMSAMPPLIASIGEFANPTVDEFSDAEEAFPTIYSRLAGDEDVQLVRSCGPDVIKVVRYDEATIAGVLARWDEEDAVCAVSIEVPAVGGLDWSLLRSHIGGLAVPVLLSGALTIKQAAEAIVAVRPFGVELCPGAGAAFAEKDLSYIEEFCAAVQSADRE